MFGQITTTKLAAPTSAAAQQAENLRQSLRSSAAADIQGLCKSADFVQSFHPMGVAKACASQHVRYNGTPFRDAVRKTMNVLVMQQGPASVGELVALLGAMIAQETDLTSSQGQSYMWEDAATVGVKPTLTTKAIQTALAPTTSTFAIRPGVLQLAPTAPSAGAQMTPVPLLPVPSGAEAAAPAPFPETTTMPAEMPGGGFIPATEEPSAAPAEGGGGGVLATLTSGRTLLYIGLGVVLLGGGYYVYTRRR